MNEARTLNVEQVAEHLDRASSRVDRNEADRMASALQRDGLVVVRQDPLKPTLDQLFEALKNDPNIVTKGESTLPRPRFRFRRKRRGAGQARQGSVGTGV